jgi:hypothetical protein
LMLSLRSRVRPLRIHVEAPSGRCLRNRFGLHLSVGGSWKLTRSIWPVAPSSPVNQMEASYRRPGASPRSWTRPVSSARSSTQGPCSEHSPGPLLSNCTAIRPLPEERAQSTAESVVTSPDRAPWVRDSRCRTWPGARPGQPAARSPGVAPTPTPPRRADRLPTWGTPRDHRSRLSGPSPARVVSPNAGRAARF